MPKALMEVDLEFLRDALHLPHTTDILAVIMELPLNRITLLLEDGEFPEHEQGCMYPRISAQFMLVEGMPLFDSWIRG